MRLEWAPRAERELAQIRDYIAQDSPFYARQFTERLVTLVEHLPDHPRKGRTVPEADYRDHIREIIYQGYRIIYRVHSEQLVQIVAVLHGSRNLDNSNNQPWANPDAES